MGMNCSFCASTGAAIARAPRSATSAIPACLAVSVLPIIGVSPLTRRAVAGRPLRGSTRLWGRVCPRIVAASIRERPQPKLLLADRPEPGEAMWLGNQKEHDNCPEQH